MNDIKFDKEIINAVFVSIGLADNEKLALDKYSIEEETVTLVWHVFGFVGTNNFASLFSAEFDGDPGYVRSLAAFKRIKASKAHFCLAELLDLFSKTDPRKSLRQRAKEFAKANKKILRTYQRAFADAEAEIVSKLSEYIREHRSSVRTIECPDPTDSE